jgi:hypothetical protein
MLVWSCPTCPSVVTTSEHSKQAHLKGKKHMINQKSQCYTKRNVFRETSANIVQVQSTGPAKRPSETYSSQNIQDENCLQVEYKLFKETEKNETSGLAPIFTPKKTQELCRFPEECKDIFYRKKGVNLFIKNEQVVWEFSFDRKVIDAIKAHIPGRQWNPIAKKWTSPVEGLPDAIALYKHMGREADESLKKRAKKIVEACGGANPNELISLSLTLKDMKSNNILPVETLGKVSVKFMYNAEIVDAIKNLPPSQRSFDPTLKVWPIDLLALPDLLEHLLPLGYAPCEKVKALCTSCRTIARSMYNCPEMQARRSAEDEQVYALLAEADECLESMGSKESKVENDAPPAPAAYPPDNEGSNLGESVKELVSLLLSHKNDGQEVEMIDRGDCGESSKRRRLTEAQETWARRKILDHEASPLGPRSAAAPDRIMREEYFEGFDGFDFSLRLAKRLTTRRASSPIDDCDCGSPWKMSGNKHVCRYFGTFQCACENRWTSAYTWKGEMQACKSCNQESFPVKKDKLESGKGRGGLGHHDSLRCGRCRKLGYDCSEASYMY